MTASHAQLRAFHYTARLGGFTRAADALRLTQPAVSEQIKRLERDHDVLLFNRDRKLLRLTHAGELLFKLTQQWFEVEERIGEQLSRSRSSIEGKLRIVADNSVHIAAILKKFRDAHAKVQVSIQTGNTQAVLSHLRNYQAEIGIAASLPQTSDLELIELSRTPIVAFAQRGYFGAPPPILTLDELARHYLVLREPGSSTRQAVGHAFEAHGLEIAHIIEAEGREAVSEIVAAGLGVGFVSMAEFGHDARLECFPIEGIDLNMSEFVFCLTQRRDLAVIRSFMKLARQSNEKELDQSPGAKTFSLGH